MRTTRFLTQLGSVALVAALLSACAETKFVMHTAKRLGETNKSQGDYKVGKPYQINGVWYYPKEDMSYDRTGIASWYGPNFHGKATANGEVFDQWSVSAAHKTLPMPSVVRVTNLVNGRSLVVRINDRGPFKPGRIIDLSRRAAQLLGIEKTGTAQVRVQILPQESRVAAQRAKGGGAQLASADAPIKADNVASQPVASQQLPEPPRAAPQITPQPAPEQVQSKLYVQPQQKSIETVAAAPVQPAPVTQTTIVDAPVTQAQVGEITQVAVSPTQMYVQAGAFSNASNAERVKARLSSIGAVNISSVSVGGRSLFRVRLGPVGNVAEADQLLAQVVEAGYANARTVVERTVAN